MQLTTTDRILAALACAYFVWRVVSAIRTGVYAGDGDRDVHAEQNPAVFVLTVISGIVVAVLLALLIVAPGNNSHRTVSAASQDNGANNANS